MPQPFTRQNAQQQDSYLSPQRNTIAPQTHHITKDKFQRILHLKNVIQQEIGELSNHLRTDKDYANYLYPLTTQQNPVQRNKKQHSRTRSRTKRYKQLKAKSNKKKNPENVTLQKILLFQV